MTNVQLLHLTAKVWTALLFVCWWRFGATSGISALVAVPGVILNGASVYYYLHDWGLL